VATVDEWYAPARLGVAVCGVYTWGKGCGKRGKFYIYVSRIVEKGAAYTLAILRDALPRIDLSDSDVFSGWSDGGKHFRCNATIATLGIQTLREMLKQSPCEQPRVDNQFGVPKHFKNLCDGAFGQLKGVLKAGAAEKVIGDLPELIDLWRANHADSVARDPTVIPMEFIDFVPPDRATVNAWTTRFTRGSFKAGIMTSQAWSMRLNDKRRRANFMGNGVRKNMFTAIDFKCHMIHGQPASAEMTCWPVLDVEPAPAAALFEGAEEPDGAEGDELRAADADLAEGNAGIAYNIRMTPSGWRTSFRKTQPEKRDVSEWYPSLARQKAAFNGIALQAPKRQKTDAEKLLRKASLAGAKKKRQAA
jgi:hypothetical protein